MTDVKGTTALKPTEAASTEAPTRGRARRPRREAVRRRLLDAAVEVFAELGFDGASVDQVASAAGLTKGAVYSNFASKDDLFFAMMSDQVLRQVEIIRVALAAHPVDAQRAETLEDIGRLLTEALVEQRKWRLVLLDFWRRALRDDEVRARFVAQRTVLRAAIAENVERALGQAPAPDGLTLDDAVTVVLALSNGLAIEQYVSPEFVSEGLFGRVLELLSR